jgi:UDP-N-acetylglucosamine 2-epimerase
MRTLSVVGARPQFIKLAAVSRAMDDWASREGTPIDDVILHTGQHYDREMSEIFFEELQIPEPAINLNIGSGSHASQTARMMEGIESHIEATRPDVVVIYGDTNSTLAAALAAAKLEVPVAHIEAGLRSFNRSMPEEINRIVSDHVSDMLFAPTRTAIENLEAENLGKASYLVGDVMLDALLFNRELASERSDVLARFGLEGLAFGVVTIHRAGNTDSKRLESLLTAINTVADELPIVFPVHPRTVARIKEDCPSWEPHANLRLVSPLGYVDFVRLFDAASVVLTDSGGLQKEAYFVATPCVTLRDETEWPETLRLGANQVVGADHGKILDAVREGLSRDESWCTLVREAALEDFGNGEAGLRIVEAMANWMTRKEKDD